MKKAAFYFLVSYLMISCQKEPTACIEVEPSNSVTVFDEVTLKSCSEDAVWYNWEVEEFQNNVQTYQYFIEDRLVFSWDEAGTFDIYLTVKSENMKRQTSESTRITVMDVCYSCSNATTSSDICYSTYEERSTFDAALANFVAAGFTCNKN